MKHVSFPLFFCVIINIGVCSLFADTLNIGKNCNFRIYYKSLNEYSIIDSFATEDIRNNMNFISDCRRFNNPMFSFVCYDSLSTIITGNFNIADSVMFLSDLRERKSYFWKMPAGLWNALNSTIVDSMFASKDTVFIPDSTTLERVTAMAYEYTGFIEPEMSSFNERLGYSKFLLYYPPGVNAAALRSAMSNIGVLFE